MNNPRTDLGDGVAIQGLREVQRSFARVQPRRPSPLLLRRRTAVVVVAIVDPFQEGRPQPLARFAGVGLLVADYRGTPAENRPEPELGPGRRSPPNQRSPPLGASIPGRRPQHQEHGRSRGKLYELIPKLAPYKTSSSSSIDTFPRFLPPRVKALAIM